MRVTVASVPGSTTLRSASTSRNPSACENVVTEPEPLASGNAIGPFAPATSATSTNSLRPNSDGIRTGTVASTVIAASGGNPALARITGATKAWNVKIAEV